MMSFSSPWVLLLMLAALGVVVRLGWPRNRFRRRRDVLSLVLRSIIVVLLFLALAGAQLTRTTDALAVVFLVDASDSVGAVASEQALAAVRERIAQMGPTDAAGIVLFGRRPQIARPVSASTEVGAGRSEVERGDSDLAAAVRLALAMFPDGAARRIVVLSDGRQTTGDAEQAARLAAANGVQIDYLPLAADDAPDIRISQFDAPPVVGEGQQFDLGLTVESDLATSARIDIFAGADLIYSEERNFNRGLTALNLPLTAGESGFRDFTARIQPLGGQDGFIQNNQLSSFSQVVGPARVLLVGTPDETQYLAAALEESGLVVDVAAPGSLPATPTGYVSYESVVIANVPATDFSTGALEAIQIYVRDLGGGLLVSGGPDSFAPGRYVDTPLEAMLPVEMSLQDQQRQPKLTIAYVIDRSGSMGSGTSSGTTLIELAKAAINRSIDFLQPRDLAGVASFDTDAYWVAEFQEVGNTEELRRLVGTLRPSGGTDIGAGLALVAADIVTQPSESRHIILLSDGIANRRGLIELVERLYNDHGVTLTAVAIGEDSALMEDLAEAGRGTYRRAADPQTIPAIFAQETVLVTRTYIFEETFTPTLTARSPILDGIGALPALQGYVGATEKAAAQVVLRGPQPYADPILTTWQYGLGRAVAFNGDATARWGADWVAWSDFARFWGQAVRWTMVESSTDGIETRIVEENGQARIVLDARSDSGAFINGLALDATIVQPDLSLAQAVFRQTAPGRYEATFTPNAEGAYLLRMGGGADGIEVNHTAGWVVSYSREYQGGDSVSILPELAALTGGRGYADGLTPAFDRTLTAQGGSTPLAPWLLLIAALLLPFDIAVRRLLVTRSDWQRLSQALRLRPVSPAEAATPSGRMATLRQAVERARQTATVDESPSSTAAALRSRLKADPPPQTTVSDAPPAPAPKPPPAAPVVPAPKPSAPPPPVSAPAPSDDSSGNIGSRLLKRKQDRQTPNDGG